MTIEEYYEQIRKDSPHKPEKLARIDARTAYRLEKQLEQRRKQLGGIRLVPPPEKSFVNALFGAIDTTGKLPAVKKPQQGKEQAG